MKNLKRLFTIFLAFTLIISSGFTSFAKQEENNTTKKVTEVYLTRNKCMVEKYDGYNEGAYD